MKRIRSQAPTRIDLAGGTVDIWPIYLFLKSARTLNLAIDLYAQAEIEHLSEPVIILEAQDQNERVKLSWGDFEFQTRGASSFTPPRALELHYKLAKYFFDRKNELGLFSPQSGMRLQTSAKSPAGAGLGGSSALSIAMVGALATWALDGSPSGSVDPTLDGEKFIEIVRDVETTVIGVPAGLQDYYGAMYGGLQSLRWGTGVHDRRALTKELVKEVESRILLFYSGQSRNSGINNWALFKDFIDLRNGVKEKFERICSATIALEEALLARNWDRVGTAIAEEWDVRKSLAHGITTQEMDVAISKACAIEKFSAKVCGAGGGGCFFIYSPSGFSKKPEIINEFLSHGMRHLEFQAAPTGLSVRTIEG